MEFRKRYRGKRSDDAGDRRVVHLDTLTVGKEWIGGDIQLTMWKCRNGSARNIMIALVEPLLCVRAPSVRDLLLTTPRGIHWGTVTCSRQA